MADAFLDKYKSVLSNLKESKNKNRHQDPGRKNKPASPVYAPASVATSTETYGNVPASYIEKYGSDAGPIWRSEQGRQQQIAAGTKRTYEQAGATAADIDRYGSSAADIARARGLNTAGLAAAQKRFEIGLPEDRNAALQESLRLAQSASNPANTPEAIRAYYTKNFAAGGDNPNVFGMKDLQSMENTGASPDEIKRVALTINRVGPLAARALATKYGIRDTRFNW